MKRKMSSTYRIIAFSCLMLFACSGAQEYASVSQISPKSSTAADNNEQTLLQTSDGVVVLLPATTESLHATNSNVNHASGESVEANQKIRVERSASPVLNHNAAAITSDVHGNSINDLLDHVDTDDVALTGKYPQLIEPTKASSGHPDLAPILSSQRTGKDLSDDSFLGNGDLRQNTSGSQISPTFATLTTSTATLPHNARQNPSPDIQDIITGIVKLLNGNVNVHANTQTSRRPVATRINNRGPPRISEAQPLPNIDYEQTSMPTMRPPPYPFDRPETPVRPFLTGVPIPEQIVPSMQNNYRPAFISQNRPPWQRPRPRPPITGNRRPIPPYKPVPSMSEYRPEDEIQLTTINPETVDMVEIPSNNEATLSNNSYEVEENQNESANELAVSTNNPNPEPIVTEPPVVTKKGDENSKKKDKMKSTDKNVGASKTKAQATATLNALPSVKVSPSLTLEPSVEEVVIMPSSSDSSSILSITTTPTLIATSVTEVPLSSNIPGTTTSTKLTATTSSETIIPQTSSSKVLPQIEPTASSSIGPTGSTFAYHPRPGLVLDDPEFKPGHGRPPHTRPPPPPQQQQPRPDVRPTQPLPDGYGEIFDVTLSAIQGPGGSGSQQSIKIKPYGGYNGLGAKDIIVSPTGDDGFVSIDGKRTYINLFGESTDAPTSTAPPVVAPTQVLPPGVTGSGYAVPETEAPPKQQHISAGSKQRPPYRPRPPQQQPPVRIDTCIVGDDSTCDVSQNEKCKTDIGISSCHCRPGYARRKHREPCRRVITFIMSLRVDKIYEKRIVWDQLLNDVSSDAYAKLSYESIRAIDSAMSMTPFSDDFLEAQVNKIYQGDAAQGSAGVFVNLTMKLEENGETMRPNVKSDVQKHLLGVIHRRNNNIGNSALYVESPPGSISNLQDLDECRSPELNDCHAESQCINMWGSFRCECREGLRDPWFDQPQRAGRECHACPDAYCNSRGVCSYDNGNQVCTCSGNYYGAQCEVDGEVLGVAIGASVAAVLIIVLTLVCLVMWSRRWHREQKNAIGSPVFGYMTAAQVKTPGVGQPPYQVTLEDRMRWAQIADVMAQANHYGAEPVNTQTRPSSAMFGYPNLQSMTGLNTLTTMSMAGTLPMHSTALPPVPLPRLGLNTRSNGMRTLENSSSSEEEDRTDLLGRNFQVPRPKSRSNGSITSGIYYDVDYAPSGNDMYGGNNTNNANNHIPGPQGIPMSTYTSGRAPASYYMK